jgi:hypothetical protein
MLYGGADAGRIRGQRVRERALRPRPLRVLEQEIEEANGCRRREDLLKPKSFVQLSWRLLEGV